MVVLTIYIFFYENYVNYLQSIELNIGNVLT